MGLFDTGPPGSNAGWEGAERVEELTQQQVDTLQKRLDKIPGYYNEQRDIMGKEFDINQGQKYNQFNQGMAKLENQIGQTGFSGSGINNERKRQFMESGIGMLKGGLLGYQKGLENLAQKQSSDEWDIKTAMMNLKSQGQQTALGMNPEYDWDLT